MGEKSNRILACEESILLKKMKNESFVDIIYMVGKYINSRPMHLKIETLNEKIETRDFKHFYIGEKFVFLVSFGDICPLLIFQSRRETTCDRD